MKRLNLLVAFAAAGAILTAQPVFAAGNSVMMNDSAVITVGAAQAQEASGGAPGMAAEPSQNSGPAMSQPEQGSGSAVIVAGSSQSSEAEAGTGTEIQSQAPGNDSGSILQPVGPDGAIVPVEEEQKPTEAAQNGRVIDPSKPMVALTFDDGPQSSVGNRIMDVLNQYNGKATFFMVGERVASHAAEVQRMVAEGHEVANHTMNHKYLQKLGAAEIQSQVAKGNDAIEAVCGVRPTILRLPGGNHNATVRANTHMPMIQWSIDTLDWKTRNADKTVAAVLDHVKDGDIILMHELYSQSGDAAVRLIPELTNRGYQLVTVSEMAAAKGQALEAGKIYSSFR